MDFNFVTARVATGAAIHNAQDVDVLAKAGITHVINCRDDQDEAPFFAQHPEMHYIWNPTADDGKPKPPDWFAKSISFALEALSHPKNKVYAHCAAGVNRGPS